MKNLIFLSAWIVLMSLPGSADSTEEKRVVDHILQQDSLFAQGDIKYHVIENNNPSVAPLKPKNSPAITSSDWHFRYDKNRFWLDTQSTLDNGTISPTTQIWDNQYLFRFLPFQGHQQAFVSTKKPTELSKDAFLIGVAPGASLIMGRGLSRFGKFTVSKSKLNWEVEGQENSGERFTAVLDEKHDFVATKIQRFRADRTLQSIFLLSKPVKPDGGTWLASSAIYRVLDKNGGIFIEKKFQFVEGNFYQPAEGWFKYQLPPKGLIGDERFGTPVMFENKTNKDMTDDEIRPITTRLASEQTRLLTQTARYEQKQNQNRLIRIVLISLPALTIFLTVGYLLIKRKKSL